MYEDYAVKLAKIMTEYSVPIHGGEFVAIVGSLRALPAIEALYEAVIRRGGNPTVQLGIPGLDEIRLEHGNDDQLQFVDPIFEATVDKVDVFYNIMAPSNTKGLNTINPARLALAQKAGMAIQQKFFQRIGDGSLRWMLAMWPTESAAQEGEMGIQAYRKFVYEACGFHYDDPVAYWLSMKEKQMRLVDYLADKHHAQIKGPGIDLSFEFGERVWVSCHGELNFPDGEIFTGPIEDSVNGTVEFNLRTMYGGREVNGVKLRFKDGLVTDASATKSEDYLYSQLDMDDGSRRLGEFAIGTNWGIQRVTGNTLFDEKIGGTIHMALGQSIPESLGVNVSNVHWDMVHDMKDGGEITIDGVVIYRNGEFIL